jgi:hypothetical protein
VTDKIAAMKIQPSYRTIFAGVFLVLISACATAPRTGPAALAGTWTNSLGTVWTINADGTFDVDRDHDGTRDFWGTYTVAGDTVTVQGTGGRKMKGCDGPGVYKFNRSDENNLAFTFVSDKCKDRKKNVLLAWHKK